MDSPLEDNFGKDPLHIESLTRILIICMSAVAISMLPQQIINGAYLIGIPYLGIVLLHSIVLQDTPTNVIYNVFISSVR